VKDFCRRVPQKYANLAYLLEISRNFAVRLRRNKPPRAPSKGDRYPLNAASRKYSWSLAVMSRHAMAGPEGPAFGAPNFTPPELLFPPRHRPSDVLVAASAHASGGSPNAAAAPAPPPPSAAQTPGSAWSSPAAPARPASAASAPSPRWGQTAARPRSARR